MGDSSADEHGGLMDRQQPLYNIEKPHTNDVLCGRGVTTNKYPGNEKFRSLVGLNKELYVTSTKRQKMAISRSIVEAVRSMKPPGRFLEKDPDTGYWSDIGDRKAIEKTSQALRDGAATLRRQLSHDLGDPDFLSAVFDMDSGSANAGAKEKDNQEKEKEKKKPIKAKAVKKGHRRTRSNPDSLAAAKKKANVRRLQSMDIHASPRPDQALSPTSLPASPMVHHHHDGYRRSPPPRDSPFSNSPLGLHSPNVDADVFRKSPLSGSLMASKSFDHSWVRYEGNSSSSGLMSSPWRHHNAPLYRSHGSGLSATAMSFPPPTPSPPELRRSGHSPYSQHGYQPPTSPIRYSGFAQRRPPMSPVSHNRWSPSTTTFRGQPVTYIRGDLHVPVLHRSLSSTNSPIGRPYSPLLGAARSYDVYDRVSPRMNSPAMPPMDFSPPRRPFAESYSKEKHDMTLSHDSSSVRKSAHPFDMAGSKVTRCHAPGHESPTIMVNTVMDDSSPEAVTSEVEIIFDKRSGLSSAPFLGGHSTLDDASTISPFGEYDAVGDMEQVTEEETTETSTTQEEDFHKIPESLLHMPIAPVGPLDSAIGDQL